jgi:multiple sugar transport system substrate-binding protein
MPAITLQGITWGHSRGLTPLLAAAQRYNELHPNVEITWKKRSLQEFADYPLEKLTTHYDLLIIDHPWVGCAAATGCVLPLEQYVTAEYMADQLKHTVGYSHLSYQYEGHQWAFAIDAATPAASYRADLLARHQVHVPQTWEEVIALAKAGRVAVPAIPIDLLMNFYMFCIAHGKTPFQQQHQVIDEATGLQALETMYELYSLVDQQMFGHNPIQVAERMSRADDYWYCPFAYCYSNYARYGYAANLLTYTDLVKFGNSGRLRSTIGGTGIAVSAFSAHKEEAVQFAAYVNSSICQSTLYVQHGGQPGHAAAWKDAAANQLTNHFFTAVLPVMERGYVRPRYNGYLHFQDQAGNPLQQFLLGKTTAKQVLKEMNMIYEQSLAGENKTVVA